MDQGFMKTAIMKSKKLKGMEKLKEVPLKGAEKMKEMHMEMGALSPKETGKFKGAEKMKGSSVPKASKAEDMVKLDSFIKSSKLQSKEMDPEESVHNAKEEKAEGYSLGKETEELSKESPEVKKAYEEWLQKRKHLKMMGE